MHDPANASDGAKLEELLAEQQAVENQRDELYRELETELENLEVAKLPQ